MSHLKCKKCLSVCFHKSGHTRGLPRYKYKECGCQFTDSPRRGVDHALKALAIVLYAYCEPVANRISMMKHGRG